MVNFCPDQITPELVQIAPLPSGDATEQYCILPCPQSSRVPAASYQKSIFLPVVDNKKNVKFMSLNQRALSVKLSYIFKILTNEVKNVPIKCILIKNKTKNNYLGIICQFKICSANLTPHKAGVVLVQR